MASHWSQKSKLLRWARCTKGVYKPFASDLYFPFQIKFFFIFIYLFLKIFWLYHVSCGILVPQPGIESTRPTVEARSINHWTARQVSLQIKFYPLISNSEIQPEWRISVPQTSHILFYLSNFRHDLYSASKYLWWHTLFVYSNPHHTWKHILPGRGSLTFRSQVLHHSSTLLERD